jgi:hypothetical protein
LGEWREAQVIELQDIAYVRSGVAFDDPFGNRLELVTQ